MIILDTNIISAVMKPKPESAVISWLDGLNKKSVYLTSITIFEIRFGLHSMNYGKKRDGLSQAFDKMLKDVFKNRILDFDIKSADIAGKISAEQKKKGKTPDVRDTQIAAIAIANNAILVTRNIKDFQHKGLNLVNPYEF